MKKLVINLAISSLFGLPLSVAFADSQGVLWLKIPANQDYHHYLSSSQGGWLDKGNLNDAWIFESNKPIAFVEDPLVQKIVKEIVGDTKDPRQIVLRLSEFFSGHFHYDNHVSESERKKCLDSVSQTAPLKKAALCRYGSSSLTLRLFKGDCLGAAYSMAALLRAAGIPTLIAYTQPRYYEDSALASIIIGGYGVMSHYYNYVYINGVWYFLEPQRRLSEFRAEPFHENVYKFGVIEEDEPASPFWSTTDGPRTNEISEGMEPAFPAW